MAQRKQFFHFFRLYQENRSSASKVKFKQASYHCKSVLEAAKLTYANKIKDYLTFQKLGSRNFQQITNSILSKGKSVTPPLFKRPVVIFSASDKAKLFARTRILMTQVPLSAFPSRTNLKLHNM